MTRDEIKRNLQELLTLANPDSQARASELLTGISDEIETFFTNSESAAGQISKLTADNETLRAVNAKLFLKVGATEKEIHKEETPETETDVENLPTFESLFNEKGELM